MKRAFSGLTYVSPSIPPDFVNFPCFLVLLTLIPHPSISKRSDVVKASAAMAIVERDEEKLY